MALERSFFDYRSIGCRIMPGENLVSPMRAEAMESTETVGEGFQVVQWRKRRRISSAFSIAEVSKESMKKVFIKIEIGKLNPIRIV